MDNRHPCFAGDLNVGVNPALAARVRDADALLLVGHAVSAILKRRAIRWWIPAAPGKMIAHIHADADEIGRVYGVDIGVVCRGDVAVAGLSGAVAAAS